MRQSIATVLALFVGPVFATIATFVGFWAILAIAFGLATYVAVVLSYMLDEMQTARSQREASAKAAVAAGRGDGVPAAVVRS